MEDYDDLRDALEHLRHNIEQDPPKSEGLNHYADELAYCAEWFSEEADRVKE